MTTTERMMYERGFGTGHFGDLRPTQAVLPDGIVHNVLRRVTDVTPILDVVEPVPITLCGMRLDDEGEPYNRGPTTCDRCAILAAWTVVALPAGTRI